MEDTLNMLNALDEKLMGAPSGTLVVASCIVVGYAVRSIGVKDKAVPVVCLMWGMVANPLLSGACPAGTQPHAWHTRTALTGLVMGFLAWALHRLVLNRFEDKIPGLSAMLGDAPKKQDLQSAELTVIVDANSSSKPKTDK